jgi:hypothetical protein
MPASAPSSASTFTSPIAPCFAATYRCDDEEPAVARRGEGVPRVLREQERGRQEDRDERVPTVLGKVPHGRDVLEAGVRDDGVEPPVEARERGVDDDLVAFWRRQVAVVDVDGMHAPAVGGETVRDRGADSAGGAGDENTSGHDTSLHSSTHTNTTARGR